MEQTAQYPAPVLRPPVFNVSPDSGVPAPWSTSPSPPGSGSYGPWSPRPPPGPWYGGWNPWGAPHAHQQFPNMHPGGPKYFSHGHQMHEGNDNKQRRNRKKEPVYPYCCDTCDRGFKNQDKYDEHVSQHVKCQVEDCNFRAHEKLVQIHWRTMHGPGAKRIKLDTQEEITKWREERRRNFPTRQNIAKKQQLQKEKEERGEVLQTAQFGKMKGMRNNAKGKNKWFRKNQRNQRNVQNTLDDIEVEGQTETPRSKPNLDGKLTGQESTVNPLDMLAGSDAESDSGGEVKKTALTVIPRQVTSGLSKLISSYGSASDSDSEPEELAIKKVVKAVEENKQILESHSQSMAPSSSSSEKKTDASHGGHQPKHPLNKSKCNKHKKEPTKPVPGNKRPTLLEMLLAPDIRHERNVILQCVRYIVQNNFFDPVMNTNQPATSESSMKNEEDLNITENMSELNSVQHSDKKKIDAPGYFSRPIEPLDDEIWESNATCLESFCD